MSVQNRDSSTERSVRRVVARIAKVSEDSLDLGRWLPDFGIDSLGHLIARETLERVLGVHLPDDAWIGFTSLGALVDYAERQGNGAPAAPVGPAATGSAWGSCLRLRASGLLYDEVEIGMPLTGRNNFAEGPLLQHLGNLRFRHLSAVVDVPTRRIADADGNRLYPTFFYVETAFPEERPMASFGENDRFRIAGTLAKFGDAMLDGAFFLLPPDAPEVDTPPFADLEAAVAAGVPAVRFSNIFVRQFDGAAWLKKSRPANPGFERIPELAVAPDSYALVKQAERAGAYPRRPAGVIPLTAGPVRREYRLLPDRDLNGAGLVYFANYPVFLDVCERDVLAAGERRLADELIDRRTLVRRRSAYLNNAAAQDTLEVEIEAWLENPVAAGHPAPELAPIRLFLDYRLRRRSDGAVMMVSSAEKIVFGRALEDLPFFDALVADAR